MTFIVIVAVVVRNIVQWINRVSAGNIGVVVIVVEERSCVVVERCLHVLLLLYDSLKVIIETMELFLCEGTHERDRRIVSLHVLSLQNNILLCRT